MPNETLPIIKKTKAPKKGDNNEQNGKTHVQKDKWTTKEGKPQEEHQIPKPLLITKNISCEERGGPLEKMPNLDVPSPVVTTHFKIETACTHCNAIETQCL